MRCRVAQLTVDVLAEGGIAPLCKPYSIPDDGTPADITVRADRFNEADFPGTPRSLLEYMSSGEQFYYQLLRFNGMLLHASAVALDGRAYLFSAPCGTGKSTHTRLWLGEFPGAVVFNDDKPALRKVDGVWYAYGTPWCGSDYINVNLRANLGAICFLVQAKENRIRRLTPAEALQRILSQTIYRLPAPAMNALLETLDGLLQTIPVFELENLPVPEAAHLSYETMRRAAEEANL